MLRLPPSATLFPYTTLFRSWTVPVSRSTGNASIERNHNTPATLATAGGRSASGAMRPARKRDTPAWSSIIAVARVVQKARSEEHTSELQSPVHLVCRLLLEK